MESRESPEPPIPFLDTVEGEIAFFRSIMRARPIGLHRHFHVLSIRTVIHQDTGRYVSVDDLWEKLRSCYNIEALENLVRSFVPQTLPLNKKKSVEMLIFSHFLSLLPFYSGRRGLRISRFCTFHTEHRRLTLSIR
jgi:hypothetical protein